MSQVIYPFDPTGQAPSNYVTGEVHTLTEINAAPYRILIPRFAPFYLNNLSVTHINVDGTTNEMIEGVDYYAAIPYMSASRSTGKSVYGGLAIINNIANGGVRVEYQTVGSKWCADTEYVYQQLLEQAYNPRTTWWDHLTNVQEIFPPTDHLQNIEDLCGIDELIQRLTEIRQAILEKPVSAPGEMIAHMLARNPHNLTLEDMGGKNAAYLDVATDQEVLQRARVDKAITLRQLIMLLS